MNSYNSRHCFYFMWTMTSLLLIVFAGPVRAACTAAANPSGCVTVKNVCSSGGMDSTTIQGAVKLLPGNISASGNACVVIRDAANYSEQVTIPDVSMSSYTVGNNRIEILIDPSMSSGPVISPPASSTAGFWIKQASVTIGGGILIKPTNSMPYGVFASAAYVNISSVNVLDAGSNITSAGMSISGYTQVSYSSITVGTASGLIINGTLNNVSFSTALANTANASFAALFLNGASSNSVTGFFASNLPGYGAYLNNSNYNTIDLSTMTDNAAGVLPLDLVNASSNTISRSYAYNPAGDGVHLDPNSTYNTISQDNIFCGGSGGTALQIQNASYNLVTHSLITNPNGFQVLFISGNSNNNAISFSTITSNSSFAVDIGVNASSNTISQCMIANPGNNGSDAFTIEGAYNTVSQSTITTGGTSVNALDFTGGSHNIVAQSYLFSANGAGISMDNASNFNTLALSTILANAPGHAGLQLSGSNNTASQCMISNPVETAVYIYAGANGNSILMSTMTSNAAGFAALSIYASSNTISNSYVQGSTAVYMAGSTGTVINSNILIAASANGSGVWLSPAANVNLFMSSNVITGGSNAAGVYIDKSNKGSIYLSTNAIQPGSQYGVYVATQTSGTQIYIASNTIIPTITNARNTYGIYLNGLQTGATIQNNQIYYRNSGAAATTYGLYAQSSKGLNIHHNQFNEPGMITVGSYIGVSLTGTTNTLFKFNDLNATNAPANLLTQDYLLQLISGSTGAQVKDNIFSSSLTVSGGGSSSATITVDAASQSGFASDYNDFYSYNSANTAIWGATAYSLLSGWQGAPAGQDPNSISANPLWFNTTAGSEDFHPQSQTGRYSPAGQSFVQDCFTSQTIDKGDPTESFSLEPSPNGSLVNQGSYGNTAQASETFQVQPPASIGATALTGQITVSWTSPSIPQSCVSYVDHYKLAYSSVSQNSSFNSLGNVSSNTFAFVHTNLSSKTTYFYQVFTFDVFGSSSTPAQTFAVTPDSIAPAAVTNLAAAQGSAVGQVNLNWTFPGDDNGTTTLPAGSQYAIQYTTDNVSVVWSTANAQVTISTSNVPVGSLQGAVLSGLSQTVAYYFRLWTNHPGPVWSAPSNIANSFSKQPGPGINSISPADGSTCAAWNSVVTLNFNKTVQYGSLLNAFSMTLVKDNLGNSSNTAVAGAVSPASSTGTYTFTPASALIGNGTYSVSISTQALDLQGNPLSQAANAQFVTVMDRTATNTFTILNPGINLTVPAGAVGSNGCLTNSTAAVSSNIGIANQKLVSATGDPLRVPIPGSVVDFKIYDTLGNIQSGNFGSPVTISIPYPDINNKGIVDGTNPPVRASTLAVWWLDEANALWIRLPNSSVDTSAKRVTATTAHFTTFAIIGQSITDLSSAYAFPVPFRPALGHSAITFVGLAQSTRLRIFDLNAELVADLNISAPNGQYAWDVRNRGGGPVASGVYFYVLESSTDKKKGKLIIIR